MDGLFEDLVRVTAPVVIRREADLHAELDRIEADERLTAREKAEQQRLLRAACEGA